MFATMLLKSLAGTNAFKSKYVCKQDFITAKIKDLSFLEYLNY